MLCLCAAQWKFCFQTDLGRQNLASYYMQESTLAFDFSHHGHALVTLYVQSLCYDWSKFDSEFMRKIYAVSWNLFTLTAEATRVLCQLVMFLTAFFDWMCKKWNSAAIKSLLSFVASLFFWVFGWEIRRLVKVGNTIWDGIVFVFHLAWSVRELKSLRRYWPYLIASRSCILNGKPE